jgi:hypothetical protein
MDIKAQDLQGWQRELEDALRTALDEPTLNLSDCLDFSDGTGMWVRDGERELHCSWVTETGTAPPLILELWPRELELRTSCSGEMSER